MNEKKLYRVRLTYDAVVVAEDRESACTALGAAMRDVDHYPAPCDESACPIASLHDLPADWSAASIPFGSTRERTIGEWLYVDKPLVVRGAPKRVATFIANMRGVAEKMGVTLVEEAPKQSEAPDEE